MCLDCLATILHFSKFRKTTEKKLWQVLLANSLWKTLWKLCGGDSYSLHFQGHSDFKKLFFCLFKKALFEIYKKF